MNLNTYSVQGELLESCITPLQWDWKWTEDNAGPTIFERAGVQGVAAPKYDDTLCSGCSFVPNIVNILVLSAFQGKLLPDPLPNVEILNGKKMQARAGFDATVLIGQCINQVNLGNPNIQRAISVNGCPPDYSAIISALREAGLAVEGGAYATYLRQQCEKYSGKPEFSWIFFGYED